MATIDIKLARIGNSQGVRLPAALIAKYHFSNGIILEANEDGILLKPKKGKGKLSWQETALQMASEDEDWSGWEKMTDGWEDA